MCSHGGRARNLFKMCMEDLPAYVSVSHMGTQCLRKPENDARFLLELELVLGNLSEPLF